MTHSPPIPPGNQAPYPTIEPSHEQHEPARLDTTAKAKVVDQTREVAPMLVMGAAVVGAVAGVVTAVVKSRREAAKANSPARRDKNKRSPAAAKAAKATTSGAAKSKPTPSKAARAKAGPSKLSEPKRRLATAKRLKNATVKPAHRAPTDDHANRGPQDASRIAMGEDYEVRYWTGRFGVDRDALQRAVDAVGNGAEAVERELAKS